MKLDLEFVRLSPPPLDITGGLLCPNIELVVTYEMQQMLPASFCLQDAAPALGVMVSAAAGGLIDQ